MSTDLEIWEPTTASGVKVWRKDPREPSQWRSHRIGGKRGTRRLQITTDEREYNEELIAVENRNLNPFRNGHLLCIKGPLAGDADQFTDEELRNLLAIDSDEDFLSAFQELNSEVLERRLLFQAEDHATKRRYDLIYGQIQDKYRVGYTQRAVREMETEESDVPTVI